MRFIVDECTGPFVAAWLRDQNYEVFSVFEDSRGMNDNDIIMIRIIKSQSHQSRAVGC